MVQRKYTIIIPIATSLLMLASVSGIIGNAILLSNTNGGPRTFTIDNLDPQEMKMRPITMPNNLDNPELTITLESDEIGEKQINIYISDDPYFSTLTNIDDFENSSYFKNEIIDFSREVNDHQTFELTRDYEILYLFFGNEGNQTVSFTVDTTIKERFLGTTSTGRIIGIIFSALLTAFFLFASIYLWFEYTGWVEPKFLTDDLEKKFDTLQDKALSWELFVAGIGSILAITGYGQILMGKGAGNLVGAIIAGGIVYYNFTSRQKIESSIKSVLISHDDLPLSELASLIGHTEEDTKKALLDAIMYSNLPATFDFKTKMVHYHPEKEPQPQSQVDDQYVSESNFQVSSDEVQSKSTPDKDMEVSDRPLPVCAYCDTEAITHTAQFCHSCGASMSSAK